MTQLTNAATYAPANFVGSIHPELRRSRTRSLTGLAPFWGRAHYRGVRAQPLALVGRGVFVGKAAPLLKLPYGAFRDFAHYSDTMYDPAMVLVGERLVGQPTYDAAAPSNMRRIWITASPMREYPVSGGGQAWPRAAFMGIGLRVNNLLYNGYQYIDGGQVEITPKTTTTGPGPYTPARSLNIAIKADLMNYVKNPQTPATVAAGSTASRTVTTIVGAYYGASVDVSAPEGTVLEAYLQDSGGRVGESGTIVVPPGGVVPRVAVHATQPVDATSISLVLRAISGGSVTFSNPRVDRTSGIGPLKDVRYLDGSVGTDYLWGGPVNNSESYYYRDRQSRTYLLSRLLEENVPLGVIPAVPKFAVLPTE